MRSVKIDLEVVEQSFGNYGNQVSCEKYPLKRDYLAKKIYENDENIKRTWKTIGSPFTKLRRSFE